MIDEANETSNSRSQARTGTPETARPLDIDSINANNSINARDSINGTDSSEASDSRETSNTRIPMTMTESK